MEIQELDDLVKEIASKREEKTQLTESLKKVNIGLEELNKRLISGLVSVDKGAWDVAGIGKASITTKTLFSVKDQEKLVNHLLTTDNKGLIKVSPNVVSGYLKEIMDELPEDQQNEEYLEKEYGVSFYRKTGLSFRKQK